MPRYIDADAVLQAMWNNLYQLEDEMEKKHGLDPIERLNVQNGFEAALKAVAAFPSSDVIERKKGKWRVYEGEMTCSCCETTFYTDICEYTGDDVPKFCPWCGADMRGEQNEHNS